MGYITISITKDETTDHYVLFHADYLNEAWLSKVREDDSTKIIKQYKCKDFAACFYEAGKVIAGLGEITKMTCYGLDECYSVLLQENLHKETPSLPANPNVAVFNRTFTSQNLWNWFAHTLPDMRMAG